ncbi:hypothetical protein BGZ61DRAFT_487665 [Ilyonectria robusta]|uniref:uncharacterized protein n=1 Tax=Ilyonectria robusta TaxID=1079257 RepID=UPI001E8EEBAB|nr:uncharacterized protein BGZ61DRAFT_487665 [Ilyonectria robusta]KAH8651653.1 hypothetical protein BGZ61DRAFT_487665 [Ilyonectria robusta]
MYHIPWPQVLWVGYQLRPTQIMGIFCSHLSVVLLVLPTPYYFLFHVLFLLWASKRMGVKLWNNESPSVERAFILLIFMSISPTIISIRNLMQNIQASISILQFKKNFYKNYFKRI